MLIISHILQTMREPLVSDAVMPLTKEEALKSLPDRMKNRRLMLALRELFEGLEVPEEELDFKVESRSDGTYGGSAEQDTWS
jgi:hypothetical protein